jgi:hypothetical protein
MTDISNSDDTIDSRDVIERIEELEALRKPWVAGWNMPGCMPDSDPAIFETFEDARDYIVSALENAVDDVTEANEGVINPDQINALIDARKRWEAIESEGEHGETVGNWHYWIKAGVAQAFEDAADFEELTALQALASEAEDYSEDWQYGATLIRDSSFTDYAQELCEDIGYLPKDFPAWIEIDWKATARNIQQDYTSVEFDGVTYWVR